MNEGMLAILYNIGSRLFVHSFNYLTAGRNPIEKRVEQIDRLIEAIPAGELVEIPARASESQKEGLLPATVSHHQSPEENQIATACIPCAIGHFAGAAKLLNEAIRFRDEGITSNQVLDDIAGAIGELNALERVDMTPEKLQNTSSWERPIADEALRESRKLRHRLEGIDSMEEIEKAAADTESYYKKLNRQWYRGRFSKLGTKKAEAIVQRVGEK